MKLLIKYSEEEKSPLIEKTMTLPESHSKDESLLWEAASDFLNTVYGGFYYISEVIILSEAERN